MDENQLANVFRNLQNTERFRVRLLFSRKARTGYTTYAPNVSNAITDDLVNLIRDNLENKITLTPVQYNPTHCCREGEIEYCTVNYVGNYAEVLESFCNPDTVDTGVNPDDLTFYCFDVSDEHNNFNYRFFRRITKGRKISSSGIMACFAGNTLNKIEQQTLGLDGYVDLVCVENQIFVLNHISLERIFRLEEEFSTRAGEALRILGESNKISNFVQFESDCFSDLRYHKTLSRMLDVNPNLSRVFDNFDNIRAAIDMFDLDIEICDGENPQIIYSDRSQRMDILRIINDAYCRSIICERQVIHDS